MAPDDVAGLAQVDLRTRDEVLDVAFAEYDRTRPILDGRVRPEGLKLNLRTGWIGEFCVKPVYEEFDVAEMSLSWFIAAKARNEPCVALPVFPLRMAVLGYMFTRKDSPIVHPSQLVGKTIATTGYRYTVNLWLRGILKDHYGLAPEQAKWVTTEPETNNYILPKGIERTIRKDKTVGQMLIDGEVDAVIGPEAPDEFRKGDPRIRRLFPDARAEFRRLLQEDRHLSHHPHRGDEGAHRARASRSRRALRQMLPRRAEDVRRLLLREREAHLAPERGVHPGRGARAVRRRAVGERHGGDSAS